MSLRNNIFSINLSLLFLLVNVIIFSQPYERRLNSFNVRDAAGIIPNTFSGGHNNIEHQFVDIDNDGDFDIFYLDSDQTFGWFENIGTRFNPDFVYSMTLAHGLKFSNWFYFVDIDGDGDLDYFSSNVDQISFYRNDGNSTSPSFIIAQDTVWDSDGQPIYSEFSCNPIFVDIDADGDFDFISGNSAGTLTYYENIGTPQNFNLKFITDFWQNIYIGPQQTNTLHGASSIDFVDIDDDNDLDLFWGDFFGKSLYVIENQGTSTNPDMHRISDVYPVNADSVYTSGFNMPRFADIDGDDDYDLFVSVLYDATVPQSLLYYENTGTPQSANEILITDDYLKTLDVGNNSSVVFVDIDDDTDLDLFIGSLKNPIGSINFLENTGTVTEPEYYFADSAYFSLTGELSMSPTFGDIDDDGDFDLIVGRFDGTLSLFNNSGTPASALFTTDNTLLDNNGVIIDVGASAFPFLLDIDNDSDLDLITGAFNGKFNLYENTGSSLSYQFTLQNSYFTGLDVGDYSSPFILDYDHDGKFDLFSGNRNGKFYYYRNDGTNLSPSWTEVTDKFIHDMFGGTTVPYFVDLDNDTDLDLILGNVKGGLYFYNNADSSNAVFDVINEPVNFGIIAFPNPFNPQTQIRLEVPVGQNFSIEIFNILGENVKSLYKGYLPAGTQTFTWEAKNNSGLTLPAGIYFVQVTSLEAYKVIKIAFLK